MNLELYIPIHNEEKILKENVLKILSFCNTQNFNFNWKIILVINGSSDASLNIASKLSQNFPKKIFLKIIGEPGKGNAITKSISYSNADIACYMDIDLAVSLNNIPELLEPLLENDYELTLGSRLLPDSKIDRSFVRELSSQTYNFLSKIILNHNFSDLQCGFKAIRVDTFKKIAPHIKSKKWFFDTELITFAKKFNYRIKEIPVDWSENRYEDRKSKVNIIRDSFNFLINLIKLRIRLWKLK